MTLPKPLLLGAIAGLLLAAGNQVTRKAEPQYEMTTYVAGFFHRGPNWTAQETGETRRIQEGHLANFRKMAEAGKLIVAGPFSDHGDLRGMLIFKLDSVDEARLLMDADPAVKSGRLTLDLHPWFAAAGLRVNEPKPAAP
jgi:uncharacterized protein